MSVAILRILVVFPLLEFIRETEKAEQINKFLRILPSKQKILILRYGLNLKPKTFRKIAEELGVKQRIITSKKTRAIRRSLALRDRQAAFRFCGSKRSNF